MFPAASAMTTSTSPHLSSPLQLVTNVGTRQDRSIRSGSSSACSPAQSPPVDGDFQEEDTFNQMLSIHVDQPIGSMSISVLTLTVQKLPLTCRLPGPANRDVAL